MYLCINVEPVTDGAAATVYDWFLPFYAVASTSSVFVRKIRLCLGQSVGDYVWDSVLDIMFGTVCWDFVCDSVLPIMFGTVCWDYVWDSVLGLCL